MARADGSTMVRKTVHVIYKIKKRFYVIRDLYTFVVILVIFVDINKRQSNIKNHFIKVNEYILTNKTD